jgi:hypothetical protein
VLLLLTGCFVAVMLIVVRWALTWWTSRSQSGPANPVPVALALAMASAWVTTTLGLQPVFGGFLAGLTMRRRNGVPDADVGRSTNRRGTCCCRCSSSSRACRSTWVTCTAARSSCWS